MDEVYDGATDVPGILGENSNAGIVPPVELIIITITTS
jgi:hypothetical protein